MNKAIFLDKDGTLINDIPYNVDPKLVTLANDSIEGLRRLQDLGYQLIVISNQSGIARGLFKPEDLNAVEQKLQELLSPHKIKLSAFFYCPHDDNNGCDCRKPKPGMILQAARQFNIDLSQSWMIGDILNDVEAGNKAGCHTVLINNGNETEWLITDDRQPSFLAKNLNQAAEIIDRAETVPMLDFLIAHV
jgi:D-glycero-D-manno-heptose 1,7-bisphosphate phosphatase